MQGLDDVLKLSQDEIFSKTPKIFMDQFVKIACYYQAYMNISSPSHKERNEFINESYNAITLLNKLIATAANGEAIEDQVKTPAEISVDNINKFLKNEKEKTPFDKIADEVRNKTMGQVLRDVINEKLSKPYKNQAALKEVEDDVEPMPIDEVLGDSTETVEVKDSVNNDDILSVSEEQHEEAEKKSKKLNDITKQSNGKSITPKMLICYQLDQWGIDKSSFGYKCFGMLGSKCKKTDTPKEAIDKIAKITKKTSMTVAAAMANVVKKADYTKSDYIPLLKKMKKEEITKEFIINEFLDFCR